MHPSFKDARPSNLEWISNYIDVVFTEDYVVLIAAADKGKFEQLVAAATANTDGKGLLAGTLLTLPVALINSAYETVYEKKNVLNQGSANAMFSQGLVAYAQRIKLVGTMYIHSTFFGMNKFYKVRLSGKFTTSTQSFDMRIYFDDETTFGGPRLVESGLTKAGFAFDSFEDLTGVGLENILKFHQEYPNA